MTVPESLVSLVASQFLCEVAFIVLVFRFRRSLLYVLILIFPAIVNLLAMIVFVLLGLLTGDFMFSPHRSSQSNVLVPILVDILALALGVVSVSFFAFAVILPAGIISRIIERKNGRVGR